MDHCDETMQFKRDIVLLQVYTYIPNVFYVNIMEDVIYPSNFKVDWKYKPSASLTLHFTELETELVLAERINQQKKVKLMTRRRWSRSKRHEWWENNFISEQHSRLDQRLKFQFRILEKMCNVRRKWRGGSTWKEIWRDNGQLHSPERRTNLNFNWKNRCIYLYICPLLLLPQKLPNRQPLVVCKSGELVQFCNGKDRKNVRGRNTGKSIPKESPRLEPFTKANSKNTCMHICTMESKNENIWLFFQLHYHQTEKNMNWRSFIFR